jgi:hypothetical protein
MSFGDRASHVGARFDVERLYAKALNDPRFQAVLNRGFAVSFDFDIPYLGGYSVDGSKVYIDRDTPPQISRGKHVFPVRPQGLVQGIVVHEHWEKTALAAWGWDYARAHELATHAEHLYVRSTLDIEDELYEALWHPLIKLAERKLKASDVQLPPDLDRTPYLIN